MGNANGKEEGGGDMLSSSEISSGGDPGARNHPRRPSFDSMSGTTPPGSSARSQSPFLSAAQVPSAPLQGPNVASVPNQIWRNQSQNLFDNPADPGIPTIITWNLGGNDVAIEGSWDNWTSRKKLHRSGKAHSILLVLTSGIYHYKFIVDGEWKYLPDLPFVSDEMGNVCNVLDVHNFLPENPESISDFEVPRSPESSYGQEALTAEDFTKEPRMVPSQLNLNVLGTDESSLASSSSSSSSKPQHVVLNHVFVQREWEPQSIVALGVTHRLESKYITVVLYKPLRR